MDYSVWTALCFVAALVNTLAPWRAWLLSGALEFRRLRLRLRLTSSFSPLTAYTLPALTSNLPPLTLWKPDLSLPCTDYPFGQHLWSDAALVDKLVPSAWRLSGALEVWRLGLRMNERTKTKETTVRLIILKVTKLNWLTRDRMVRSVHSETATLMEAHGRFSRVKGSLNESKWLLHRRRCRNSFLQSHKMPAHESFQRRCDGRLGSGQALCGS